MPIVSEQYKENKKQKLYHSALVCFAEKGFHNTTMDDIVKHSGMSKGAIYNYFKSKDEIYISLTNDRIERMFNSLRETYSNFKTSKEKINHLFDLYITNKLDKQGIQVQMDFFLHASKQEDLREIVNERYRGIYKKFINDIIEEGKINGEFNQNADSDTISSLLWALIDGISMQYSVLDDNYPYEKLMKKSKDIILSSLK